MKTGTVSIVIAGAAGRMGQALVRCARQVDGIALAGAVEHAAHAALGRDVGEIAGIGRVGVPLTADLAAALDAADVLIDFTLHSVVPTNVSAAARMGRAVVIGTTALTPEESMAVDKAAGTIPIVWAPNMSLGVNLLFAMSKRAAAILGDSYAVRIDDTHHIHKKDAPSGTALRLGEKVAEGAKVRFEEALLHDEGGTMDSYPDGRIVIRSFREGEIVGDHTVRFDGPGECVELVHHAKSRDAFAFGALHAARWVCSKRPRRYDMQDVLGLCDL